MPDSEGAELRAYPMPNPPEQVMRIAWASWATYTHRMLSAKVLTEPALKLIRRDLRYGGIWRRELLPEIHHVEHEALLDRVCRQLVELNPSHRGWYVGLGDMFPDAPDDASSIGE
jgi:hypothetical protein